jgi:hypothetical protein
MTQKAFNRKFAKDMSIITQATKGEVYLGSYNKLVKKLKKYFIQEQGAQFYDEAESDNLYLLELIRTELDINVAA